jgi:hypothetical protein
MNLYEHLEIVEPASGLSMEQIMDQSAWDSMRLAAHLSGDALVSFNVIRSFRESITPVAPQVNTGKLNSIYSL